MMNDKSVPEDVSVCKLCQNCSHYTVDQPSSSVVVENNSKYDSDVVTAANTTVVDAEFVAVLGLTHLSYCWSSAE